MFREPPRGAGTNGSPRGLRPLLQQRLSGWGGQLHKVTSGGVRGDSTAPRTNLQDSTHTKSQETSVLGRGAPEGNRGSPASGPLSPGWQVQAPGWEPGFSPSGVVWACTFRTAGEPSSEVARSLTCTGAPGGAQLVCIRLFFLIFIFERDRDRMRVG